MHFERAYRLGEGVYGPLSLISVMRAAFAAGEVAEARAYATEALASAEPIHRAGDTRHRANILLGRIALAEDDVAAAGKYLLAAGQTEASPSLSTFGPNMRLAQELLERDERDVVLEYFELCKAFWKEDRLEEWATLVREGNMPEFGGNKAAGNLSRRLRVLTHPALLVVDEIGYLPVTQEGAVLFFQLINARHERASTVLTSNKDFEEWGTVLGDEVMAAALIDRLLHHCHIVNIRGNS